MRNFRRKNMHLKCRRQLVGYFLQVLAWKSPGRELRVAFCVFPDSSAPLYSAGFTTLYPRVVIRNNSKPMIRRELWQVVSQWEAYLTSGPFQDTSRNTFKGQVRRCFESKNGSVTFDSSHNDDYDPLVVISVTRAVYFFYSFYNHFK